MERLRQQQEALRAAHQRNEKDLASFPQVLVEHPRYGRAVVRGGSNCQALEQAALLWGMTPQDLGDETRVWQLAGYQAQHPELGELAALSMTREELAALAREKYRRRCRENCRRWTSCTSPATPTTGPGPWSGLTAAASGTGCGSMAAWASG